MIGNTILFLNAGFQTTAETMMYVFYELAMNPEVQQKVRLNMCKNRRQLLESGETLITFYGEVRCVQIIRQLSKEYNVIFHWIVPFIEEKYSFSFI